MEKLNKNITSAVIIPLGILLMISFPIKTVSLLFFMLFVLYKFIALVIKGGVSKNLIILLLCFAINLIFLLLFEGVKYIGNYFLFILFISPILLFIIEKPKREINIQKLNASNKNFKKVIESYLFIQIIFSLIGVVYRLYLGFSFDSDFGDIVAGTFRLPFLYKTDASNVIFTFMMILTLFIYINVFKKTTNRFLILLSVFIIFLASVNHLILAAACALAISYSFKKPFHVIFVFSSAILLYILLQPDNFDMIIRRMENILLTLKNPDLIASLSFKGQFIYNFFIDFKENLFRFVFTGVGAGTYSSRAALFFTGEYSGSFPFIAISPLMENNTYMLWKQVLDAPAWRAGAFHYPYSSVFSFIAELGLVGTVIIASMFVKKIRKLDVFNSSQTWFLVVFLFLAGLADNYYEYFQATFIFYFFIYNLNETEK